LPTAASEELALTAPVGAAHVAPRPALGAGEVVVAPLRNRFADAAVVALLAVVQLSWLAALAYSLYVVLA